MSITRVAWLYLTCQLIILAHQLVDAAASVCLFVRFICSCLVCVGGGAACCTILGCAALLLSCQLGMHGHGGVCCMLCYFLVYQLTVERARRCLCALRCFVSGHVCAGAPCGGLAVPLLAQRLGGRGGVGVLCGDKFCFWACARWCPLRGFAVPLLAQQLGGRSSVCVLCGDKFLFLGVHALVPLARVCYTLIGSTTDHEQMQQHLCALQCFISGVSVHARTGAACMGLHILSKPFCACSPFTMDTSFRLSGMHSPAISH